MQELGRRRTGRHLMILAMVTGLLALMLTGCGDSLKSVELSHDNGAQVKLIVDTINGTKVSASGASLTVKMASGNIAGELIDVSDANQLIAQHYDDGTYSEMTINGGTGFGYGTEQQTVHVIFVDNNTYLKLTADEDDALFDLEQCMTIESVAEGSGSDFGSQVQQHGAGSEDEQRNPDAIQSAQDNQNDESETDSENTGSEPGDPFGD